MVCFLFVDSERVWRGGQDQLFTLLRGLILRGHKVSLICHPRTLLESRAREAGADVYPVPFRKRNSIVALFRAWRIIRRLKPDILAFNTPHPILICNLASRFSTVRARIIFRRVNFPLRKNLITRLKYSWGIDCIVAISESIGSQLRAGGIPGSRIRTIYEGIDLTPYSESRPPRSLEPFRPSVVGTLAYLSREKGFYFLVEAAALIPEVERRIRFVIVGDGECRGELEAQVRKRGLEDCFEFAGFQHAPAKYLDRFDIFVLPSLSEGLSSSILSAMASSLPVVATEVGGIPELIRHGQNGLLVAPGNAAALAAAIQDLVEHPEKAAMMGRSGRALLQERFTLERKIQETERLCLSLLQGSKPAHETVDAKSV
jgi:glycosyltransferase involved in cell wall biosynthesis